MPQLIKSLKPLRWAVLLLFFSLCFYACGGDGEKKEEQKTEETPKEKPVEQVAPSDSLPKIDTSASGRPEHVKT